VHEATGHILSQILQACFDDRVVGPDFPRDTLRVFVYLAGDRRLLTTQYVLVSAANHTILINRKLEEHIHSLPIGILIRPRKKVVGMAL
jgi:hypothetical protein